MAKHNSQIQLAKNDGHLYFFSYVGLPCNVIR